MPRRNRRRPWISLLPSIVIRDLRIGDLRIGEVRFDFGWALVIVFILALRSCGTG